MRYIKKHIFVFVILLGFLFLFCGEQKDNPSTKKTTLEKPEVGFSAPDFVLNDFKNKAHRLSGFKGKVVLLNFWASWCSPCRMEMPSMEAIYQDMKDRGFEILAVNLDRGESERAREFVSDYQLNFPVLVDPYGETAIRYRVTALPTSFLLDKEGVIKEKIIGGKNWSEPSLLSKIETLMQE